VTEDETYVNSMTYQTYVGSLSKKRGYRREETMDDWASQSVSLPWTTSSTHSVVCGNASRDCQELVKRKHKKSKTKMRRAGIRAVLPEFVLFRRSSCPKKDFFKVVHFKFAHSVRRYLLKKTKTNLFVP
jgi:hypothetical protein